MTQDVQDSAKCFSEFLPRIGYVSCCVQLDDGWVPVAARLADGCRSVEIDVAQEVAEVAEAPENGINGGKTGVGQGKSDGTLHTLKVHLAGPVEKPTGLLLDQLVRQPGQSVWLGRLKSCAASSDGFELASLMQTSEEYQWSARELLKLRELYGDTGNSGNSGYPRLLCRDCGHPIVSLESIKQFKELPSEFWSELLDFWHCHKPDIHPEGPESAQPLDRFSSFTANAGVCLVASTYLLFHVGDAVGCRLDSSTVLCRKCGHSLGMELKPGTLKLWKWSLALELEPGGRTQTYSEHRYLFHKMVDLLNGEAVSRVRVCRGDSDTAFTLWCLGALTAVSVGNSGRVLQGLKVLYRLSHQSSSATEEEVMLPDSVYDKVWQSLQEFNRKLPVVLQRQMDWNVSFLDNTVSSE